MCLLVGLNGKRTKPFNQQICDDCTAWQRVMVLLSARVTFTVQRHLSCIAARPITSLGGKCRPSLPVHIINACFLYRTREAEAARAEAQAAQADAAALAEELAREHRARQQVRENLLEPIRIFECR